MSYTLTIGETLVAIKEGEATREVEFTVVPIVRKGICYVALTDIAELFGFTVELSEYNSTAILTPVDSNSTEEEETSFHSELVPRINF